MILANVCACFSTTCIDHEFILMDNDNLTKYEIYEIIFWIFGVSDLYIATKEANYMKEFDTLIIFAKIRFREW